MNAKKAKELRKLARKVQNAGLTTPETHYMQPNGRSIPLAAKSDVGTHVLRPTCSRAMYKQLKKSAPSKMPSAEALQPIIDNIAAK